MGGRERSGLRAQKHSMLQMTTHQLEGEEKQICELENAACYNEDSLIGEKEKKEAGL
jgi:hypothetical protein